MKYLLDTNVCVRYLTGRSQKVVSAVQRASNECVLGSPVIAELFFGAYKSIRVEENLAAVGEFAARFVSFDFDETAAEIYGQMRANLEGKGTPIGSNDLLIASIALANDLILVTHNATEFARVPNLQIEDWE